MSENVKAGPRPDEEKQVTINIAGLLVGIILLICLIWSLFKGKMIFAYLNTILLFALAVFNHAINMIHKP